MFSKSLIISGPNCMWTQTVMSSQTKSRCWSWSGKKENLHSMAFPSSCRNLHLVFIDTVLKEMEAAFLKRVLEPPEFLTCNWHAELRNFRAGRAFLAGASSRPLEWLVTAPGFLQSAAFALFSEAQGGDLPNLGLYEAAFVGTGLLTRSEDYQIISFF